MDRKNLDIVGKALNDILRNSLVPYIARELESQYMELWERVLPGSYRDWETDRKSTRLNSSHLKLSRMPSSA